MRWDTLMETNVSQVFQSLSTTDRVVRSAFSFEDRVRSECVVYQVTMKAALSSGWMHFRDFFSLVVSILVRSKSFSPELSTLLNFALFA